MQELSPKKPDWLKIRPPKTENYDLVKEVLAAYGLNTVCTSSKCPNTFECWDGKDLTFMILGNVCTRSCRFCSVTHGRRGVHVDEDEPEKIVEAAKKLRLNYVVITSVDRDDLDDYGAGHFAKCIKAIKESGPGVRVEAIIPDFSGRVDLLKKVVDARPDVITHNIETVESITPIARDRKAGYYQSINVLKNIKRLEPGIVTKSSVMLGLGESDDEVKQAIRHLHESRVDILTLGQYLRPDSNSLPIDRYVRPETFIELREFAYSLGFSYVASAPFVRSSYRAQEYFFDEVLRKGIRRM